MLLAVKIIGALCTIAVPASVCGTQAFLSKKHQTHYKKQIESEIKKTSDNLSQAYTNYNKEIKRISEEKNTLATTKATLTYQPVDIKNKIGELNTAKTTYETHHKSLQQAITTAINTHNSNLDSKKTEIQNLWSGEKTRVENIQTKLNEEISKAKTKNQSLLDSINTLKDNIEQTINNAFYTPTTP